MSAGHVYDLSVLFMRIQNLITILENLCVTEMKSEKWRYVETLCLQTLVFSEQPFNYLQILRNISLFTRKKKQQKNKKKRLPEVLFSLSNIIELRHCNCVLIFNHGLQCWYLSFWPNCAGALGENNIYLHLCYIKGE